MNALVALLLACTSVQAVAREDKIDPKWKRLYAETAQSSSFLKSNWNRYEENYHPNYILDDDAKTAWVKGGEGDGTGETVSWQVSPLKSADHVLLRVRNGYQKSEKLFKANSSVKELEVTLLNSTKHEVFRGTFPLKKTMGWQNLELAVPKSAGFSSVGLKILSVYPGALYRDLCISDVQTYVESKVPYDLAGEKSKWARLRNWIKTRLSTAKYFSSKPAEFPFAASTLSELDSDRSDDPTVEYDDQGKQKGGLPPFSEQMKSKKPSDPLKKIFNAQDLERVAKLLERGQKLRDSSEWFSVSMSQKAKNVRKPDFSGKDEYLVRDVSEVLALYSMPTELSYFPTQKAVAKTEEHNDGDMGLTRAESNVKVEKDTGGLAAAVYFWRKEIGMERGIWESQRNFLVLYDDLKHVESILVWSNTRPIDDLNPQQIKAELTKAATDLEPNELLLVTPSYDSHGKIEGLTAKAAHRESYDGQTNWYESGRWGKSGGVLSLNP